MTSVHQSAAPRRLAPQALMVVAVLLLSACSSMQERSPRDRGLEPSGLDAARLAQGGEVDLGAGEDEVDEDAFDETELFPGTGVFIDQSAIRGRAEPPGEDGEITLNFEGQGIQEVVAAILGHMFQENYVISPGVSGEVTFATARPLRRDQVMPVLEMLLRWNGATLIWREGQYHVIPIAEAVRGNLVPRFDSEARGIGYEVLVVPLQYMAPSKMAEILEPYAREDGVFNADNTRNLLFLAGTRYELRNYLQIIETFDVDWLAGMSVGMFSIERIEVSELLPELEAVFGSEGETPLAGMFRFMPLERLNAIMVITPNEHYLEEAERWIRRLDRSSSGAGSRLYVYRVKNLEADVLAGYLGDLFGTGGTRQPRRETRGGLAPGMEPASVSSVGDFQRSQQQQQQQTGQQGQRQTQGGMQLGEDGDVRITAVNETNSLLIQASPSQYDSILSAIKRLDEEPLQVLIEAQVLVVELDNQLEYGVNWFLANRSPEMGGPSPPSGFAERRGDNRGILSGGAVFNVTRRSLDRTFVAATIQALESVSNLRSIASPSLMVRNNSQASINVGRQVPVQSTRFVGGGVGDGQIGSVQYLNTGVILEVTPRVNPGGLVYLTIRQEVSNPVADPSGEARNPAISTRQVSTEVAVQSGQTIMLGGLIDELEEVTRNGVPGLQRIPFLGGLFRTSGNQGIRTETLVLITPTVIESTDALREVSDEVRNRFRALEPLGAFN